jgi:hypothetical protein
MCCKNTDLAVNSGGGGELARKYAEAPASSAPTQTCRGVTDAFQYGQCCATYVITS